MKFSLCFICKYLKEKMEAYIFKGISYRMNI